MYPSLLQVFDYGPDNALSLLLFLCIDVLIWEVALKDPGQARRRSLAFAAQIAVMLAVFAVFYLPHFYWVVVENSASVTYFGRLPNQYVDGLWPDLPRVLDLGLSWSALLAAKILYLTRMRPSFGDSMAPLVILRILPSVIMLPGLLWLIFRAEWRVRLFVVLFLARFCWVSLKTVIFCRYSQCCSSMRRRLGARSPIYAYVLELLLPDRPARPGAIICFAKHLLAAVIPFRLDSGATSVGDGAID